MSKVKNVTLAMDLSMTSPGFAIVGTYEGKPFIMHTEVLKTDSKRGHGYRLTEIELAMIELIDFYEVEHIVREKGFSRFAHVTQTLFKVVGVSDMIAHKLAGIDVSEIPTTTVKKEVTGSGKATKEEVAEAVFKLYQVDKYDEFYTKRGKLIDDKTDACAVGYAYLKNKGLVK